MEQISTSHNKRFSEMAVGVGPFGFPHLLTACGGSRCGAPSPPLRQVAGRYEKLKSGVIEMVAPHPCGARTAKTQYGGNQ